MDQHSKSILRAEGGLDHERLRLVEEQKVSRARARKFIQETNRRRRGLEERQKQLDIQEQRQRQNILLQRRQKLQDATERFQRAHLPPSQRFRQLFRRNVPNLEDAFNHLQDTPSSDNQQSSLFPRNSSNSRTQACPKPATASKSSNLQGLSALEAYTIVEEVLHKQSMTSFKNCEQNEKTQAKQQDHNLQDSCLFVRSSSGSLSNKDSLEIGDHNCCTQNLQCSHSSTLVGSEKSDPDLGQRKERNWCPTSDLTSFSLIMFLGDNLPQSRNLNEPKQKIQEDPPWPNNKMHLSNGSWGFKSVGKMHKSETQTQSARQNWHLLSPCEIRSANSEHFEADPTKNSPNEHIIAMNGASSSTALHSSCVKEESMLDIRKQRMPDERQLKHPSTLEILFPAGNCNRNDILCGFNSNQNVFLNNSTTENTSQEGILQETTKEIQDICPQKDPSASINNLNKVTNTDIKNDPPMNRALLEQPCLRNIQSDTIKCLKSSEDDVRELPLSLGKSHSACGIRLLKGILKKQTKYLPGNATSGYDLQHFTFAKQVALAIRDSVELTRAKTKVIEGNNTVKKKLRWFDEEHVEREKQNQNIMEQMKNNSSYLFQSSNNSENQQLVVTTVSSASKTGHYMTPPASSGYCFKKQAWGDVGVQVSLPQERADEVKGPHSSNRPRDLRIPQYSARSAGGHSSSRTRKGIVLRPQSATVVNQIVKGKGKTIAPHPPPRMELVDKKMTYINNTPYGVDHPSVICKEIQALAKDNSKGFSSPNNHHVIRTDTVMYTPRPPVYFCQVTEGNTNGKPSSGHQGTLGCPRRRGMISNEKALQLNCTPTEEDISLLWHEVRSALATTDERDRLRRPTIESGQVVRKPLEEQSIQPPGSGNRIFPQCPQPTKLMAESVRPFSSTYNMPTADEGFASRAKLLRAGVHVDCRLEERDVETAMEKHQNQRPGMLEQSNKQQGLTTISIEEQKILLSLDRLDQQLLYVQDHMSGNNGRQGITLDGPSEKEVKVKKHQ